MAGTITGAVLARNEEPNLEFCLRSLYPWVDELIVVDMQSTDRTREIALRYTDKVVDHEVIADFGLARGAALRATTSDWFLSIDADEVVTPRLAAWLRDFVDSDPPYEAALIPRANVFLGRWLRSTPWWPGKPRLFRREWLDVTADLHFSLVAKEGARVARLPRDPQVSLWHFTRLSLEDIASKTNHYTTIEARTALNAGRQHPTGLALFWRSFREIGVYVAKRGYRDGLGGLAYALDRAYYRFLLRAKMWDIPRAAKRRARYDRWRERIVAEFPNGGRPRDGLSKATASRDGETS